MGKKTFFGIVLIFIVTVTTSAFAQSFSTSDLEGTWIGYDTSVMPSIPAVLWLRGNAIIDASGNFTSATYTAPDGSTVSATSGSVALDAKGVMSGGFTVDTGATVTVAHGKLDSGKTHATFVSTSTDGSMDLGVFFKSGGTFSSQDLEGSWHSYVTVIDPSEGAVFWAYGTFSVSQGNMTGSFTAADQRVTAITSGTLTLDNQGIIGGGFTLDIPQNVPIQHGKLDQSKTIGAFVSVEPTTQFMAIGYLVKAGGTFSQSDGAGKWYVYGLNIDPSIPAVFWAYGESNTDASGNLKASYTVPTGDTITATGTVTMDSDGVATGAFNFSIGDTAFAPSAKMDQSKKSYVGVTISTKPPPNPELPPPMGIWRFIKAPSVALPGMPLLLLGD